MTQKAKKCSKAVKKAYSHLNCSKYSLRGMGQVFSKKKDLHLGSCITSTLSIVEGESKGQMETPQNVEQVTNDRAQLDMEMW